MHILFTMPWSRHCLFRIFKKLSFAWCAFCSPDLSCCQEVPVREEMMGREPTEPMEAALNLLQLRRCAVPVVSAVTVVVDWIGVEFPHVSGGGRSAFGWLPQLTCILCIWPLVWLSHFSLCMMQVLSFETHRFCSGPFNSKESHKRPREGPEKDRKQPTKERAEKTQRRPVFAKGLLTWVPIVQVTGE